MNDGKKNKGPKISFIFCLPYKNLLISIFVLKIIRYFIQSKSNLNIHLYSMVNIIATATTTMLQVIKLLSKNVGSGMCLL